MTELERHIKEVNAAVYQEQPAVNKRALLYVLRRLQQQEKQDQAQLEHEQATDAGKEGRCNIG